MRIIASMVTKNETSRYLQSMIEHNYEWWNDLFVYDDQSTDETREFLTGYGHVVTRPDDQPSFLQHEGIFRSNALMELQKSMDVTEDDWIFAIDSDEFLNSTFYPLAHGLRVVIGNAMAAGNTSCNLKIPEVWDINGTKLSKRVDGFWDTMSLPRVYQYKKDWAFRNKSMGCGSGPVYTYDNMYEVDPGVIELTHMGYAYPEDRQAKYDRYTSLQNHGHNHRHILSIISEPTLEPYRLNAEFWRGMR